MSPFHYKNNQLFCEEVSLAELAAQYGTPFFVYSANLIETRWREYTAALTGYDTSVCYEVDRKSTRLNSTHSQISYAVF